MSVAVFENARVAIVGYFQVGFVAAVQPDPLPEDGPVPFIPYSLPNYRIDQPTNGDGNPLPYGRLSINEGRTLGREVDGGSTRIPGILYLQIFLPENTGTRIARQAADLMTTLFQYVTLELPDGVLRFKEVSFRGNLGAINGYDRSNVEVEFTRDAFVTPGVLPNAQLGADGVLRIRNSTTGVYEAFQIIGDAGAETLAPVPGAVVPNTQTGPDGILRVLNTTTGQYEAVGITGLPGAETIVTLPG